MTDRTAVPERVSRRAQSARRGGGSGSQAVGDYVGQPAGEAAQAVRRAGLRPGLDRSFGCPAELTGLVVAQDPTAGSDMARNGMVTLYVAAPGGEPLDGDAELTAAASSAAEGGLRAPEPAEDSPNTTPARPRRRKHGLAQRPPAAVELPPAPIVPREPASEPVPAQGAVESSGEWPAEIDAPDGSLEGEPTVELGEREVSHDDEFVVQVEDVLAGRSGPAAWRGTYPRRRAAMRRLDGHGRVRGWLAEHRKLAGAIGVALALWTFVAAISAVNGHHVRTPSASALAPSRAPAVRHPVSTSKSPPASKPTPPRTRARSPRPHKVERRAASASPPPPHQRSAPRAVRPPTASETREVVAPAATGAPTPPPALQPSAAAPPPSASPAPAGEQSGGGLFSP